MNESTENQEKTTETVQPLEAKMSFKQKARLVFLTLLVILLGTFIVQNLNRTQVEFLNMNFNVSIIFIIIVSALTGALITFLMMKHRAAKKRKSQR